MRIALALVCLMIAGCAGPAVLPAPPGTPQQSLPAAPEAWFACNGKAATPCPMALSSQGIPAGPLVAFDPSTPGRVALAYVVQGEAPGPALPLHKDHIHVDVSPDNGTTWQGHEMPVVPSAPFPYGLFASGADTNSVESMVFDSDGLTLVVGVGLFQGYFALHTTDFVTWQEPVPLPIDASPGMALSSVGKRLFLAADNFTRDALYVLEGKSFVELLPAKDAAQCSTLLPPVTNLSFICSERNVSQSGGITVISAGNVTAMAIDLQTRTYSRTKAVLSSSVCGGLDSAWHEGTIYVLGSCQQKGFAPHLWQFTDQDATEIPGAFAAFGIDPEYGMVGGRIRVDQAGVIQAVTVTGEKDATGHTMLRTRFTAWHGNGTLLRTGILAQRDTLGNEPTGVAIFPMVYVFGAEYLARGGSPWSSSFDIQGTHGFAAFQTFTGVSTQATISS